MSRARAAPLHAVILAGGVGERLWPRSRARHPKPLLPLCDGASLLQATLARAARFAAPERTWLVCGRDHARAMGKGSGLPRRQLLVEPRGRNTAMAVGLAAARIHAEDPEAVLAVLPADHLVPDARAFAAAIRRAARAAQRERVLVTLGVRPTRPDTGYGYIRVAPPVGRSHPGLHPVRRFVEKPDRARATRYLRSGEYLWNAGVFVWRADAILEEIEGHAPAVHRALASLRPFPRGKQVGPALERAYRRAPAEAVDTAVLEPSRRVWCLPVSFDWSDVGTWGSLAEAVGVAPDVTQIMGGEVILHDAEGNLVWGADRPLALLGVEGLAVIDAGDALLVTRLERSSEVRAVLARLRKAGRRDLT